ncbi:MAG: adenylyltransferase/cytidyltransferase family protein [Chloroflexi bacterium]|nr:adenylyltransferase/cytidyltransferase family protein [Chloroflexota bacterium]
MSTAKPEFGMIHGRFQPFHNGHLEYLRAAVEQCENLVIGITNADPTQISEEATSEHRHLPESNPFTFFQRSVMIREMLIEEGIPLERSLIIPFPVHSPERWRYYLPPNVVHYLRVFSPWEQAKVDRLRQQGYAVEVLHPGVSKAVEATEVRRRMADGEGWEELVPPSVARVIHRMQQGR